MDEVDSARLRTGPARARRDRLASRSSTSRATSCASPPTCSTSRSRTGRSRSRSSSTTPSFAATLLPGTSADVEVVLETRDGRAAHADVGAALGRQGARGPGRRRSRSAPVEVGLRNWDVTEIRSGLAEGDAVVVSLDRPEVKAGARVRGRGGRGAVIRLEHVSRVFQVGETEVHALDDVSEHDPRRASTSRSWGPSGSGKSTLLNVIGCLDRPTLRPLPARRPRGQRSSTTRSSRSCAGT